MLRVAANVQIELMAGMKLTCAQALQQLVAGRQWEVRSAGKGSKGDRWYAWALIATASPRHFLLARRHLHSGELALHYCYIPAGQPVTISRVIRAAGLRWPVEECFEFSKDNSGLDQARGSSPGGLAPGLTLVWTAPSLQPPLQSLHHYEPPRPCAPPRYSAARGVRRLRSSLSRGPGKLPWPPASGRQVLLFHASANLHHRHSTVQAGDLLHRHLSPFQDTPHNGGSARGLRWPHAVVTGEPDDRETITSGPAGGRAEKDQPRLAPRRAAHPSAWITRHRRTVRDYERLAAHHETYVYWAMIIVITRRLARQPAAASPLPASSNTVRIPNYVR
ncbi:MAG TPA: hypothetical protein VFJ07_15980 [Streptosporangiaceae bacterium]|nr:hypothetical protein [Streptosporangiaceae bacterium]